ncbi:hypothetical protein ES705_12234 [subsurface metagenome]
MVKKEAEWIGELVGVFSDPIIVMPGGWGDSLPEWLKTSITLERLVMNMRVAKGELPTGTDAEACAYLNTASLTAPMGHDWTQIYLYIATKVYEKWRTKESGVTMPEDIRVEELDRNQMDDLNRLKAWIYRKRIAARLDRERGVRREKKEEEAEKKEALASLQQKFDLGLDS